MPVRSVLMTRASVAWQLHMSRATVPEESETGNLSFHLPPFSDPKNLCYSNECLSCVALSPRSHTFYPLALHISTFIQTNFTIPFYPTVLLFLLIQIVEFRIPNDWTIRTFRLFHIVLVLLHCCCRLAIETA